MGRMPDLNYQNTLIKGTILVILITAGILLNTHAIFAQGSCGSVQDGSWETNSTWDMPSSPGCMVTHDVYVDHIVNCSCDPLEVAGTGSITVRDGGLLIVNSDAGVVGDGGFLVEEGGVVEIRGDFELSGNAILTVDGELFIDGNLTMNGTSTFTGSGKTTISGIGCSGFTGTGICTDGPLPVELLYFRPGEHDQGIALEWSTATEVNNDYFTIEKSKDGLKFEEVARIDGAGNSQVVISYSLIDENPYKGTSYYRLRQTDYDGTTEHFNLISINYNPREINGALQVYPNPVVSGNHTYIDLPDFNGTATLFITDIYGKQVYSGTESQGKRRTLLPGDLLIDPGVYSIQLITSGEIYSKLMTVAE